MVDPHELLAFAAAAFALIVVPGPSVLFVVSRGVALGRRAALATVVGNAAGAYVQVIAVAAGLGSLIASSIRLFTAVKVVSAAYLVYLGVQAIRHRHEMAIRRTVVEQPRSTRRLVREGFVVGVTNPKVIVFFAAVLPQFVDPDRAAVPVQMAALGLVFVAIALISDSAWGLAAGSARRWFARSPGRLARVGAVGGAVTVGLGVRLAVSGRPD